MSTLQVGDRPLLTYVAKLNGAPTDATVALVVTRPDGTTVNPSIGHPALGTYTANVDVDMPDLWTFAWAASGAVVDVETGTFRVERAAGPRVYATVDELRDAFRDATGVLDEGRLWRRLTVASRAVDNFCGTDTSPRRFWRDNAATARLFRVEQPGLAWIDDFYTTTGLVVEVDESGTGASWSTWTNGVDFVPEPLNGGGDAGDGAFAWWMLSALDRPFPFHPRRPLLRVTARWGWSATPDAVAEATMLKAANLARRKDAPFGILGFGDFGPIRISRSDDPDVVRLLHRYEKTRGGSRTLEFDPQAGSLFHGGRR